MSLPVEGPLTYKEDDVFRLEDVAPYTKRDINGPLTRDGMRGFPPFPEWAQDVEHQYLYLQAIAEIPSTPAIIRVPIFVSSFNSNFWGPKNDSMSFFTVRCRCGCAQTG